MFLQRFTSIDSLKAEAISIVFTACALTSYARYRVKCASSYRKVISKTTPKFSQAWRHWECTGTNEERAQFLGVSPLVLQGPK